MSTATVATTGTPDQPQVHHKGAALALLAGVQLIIVLDAAIMNVALPTIQDALGFSDANLQWVVNSYTLAFGGFLLLGGRLADKLGRRRVFMAGMALFTAASFAGGLAQTDTWLVIARGVQGLGAAIVAPAALSILTTTFAEGPERNRAMGVWGAMAGSGGAIGVLLGGILTQYLGWEWVLFVNVPVGILVLALTPRILIESRSDETEAGFDVLGAVTVTAGLVALVYGFVQAAEDGWGEQSTALWFGLATLLLVVFLFVESFTAAPLVPLKVFARRNLSGANLVGLVVGAAMFAMFFFVTLYLQRVLGYSALKTGLAYLPLAFSIIISAGIASQLVTRLGVVVVMVPGLALAATGLFLFTRIDVDGTYLSDVLAPCVIVALGLGFTFVPLILAATAGVTGKDAGLASGLINTAQQVGGAIGLAVLSTVAATTASDQLEGLRRRPSQADVVAAQVEGFQAAFFVGGLFAVAGIVITLLVIRVKREDAIAAAEGGIPV